MTDSLHWTKNPVPVWGAALPPVREDGAPPLRYLYVSEDERDAIMRRRERILAREIRQLATERE